MPLHGDGLFQGPAPNGKRLVVKRLVDACQHDDELVGPRAIWREAYHGVVGILELIAVTDEDQALRGLVWGRLRRARKGRSEDNESSGQEAAHQYEGAAHQHNFNRTAVQKAPTRFLMTRP